MATAAATMSAPSKPAEKNSTRPCPYGCDSSGGLALRVTLNRAKLLAMTLTMDSRASDNTAAEPVS